VADAQRIKTWMANTSNPRFQVSIR
jgi:hypothetical protein